jgi:hypothetical protein
MLRFFAWVWLPLSLVNIFAQSLADSTPLRYLFSASLLFYFISLSIIVHLVKPTSDYRRSTKLIYVVQIFPMVVSILLGTILDPANQAVTIFVLITLMPVLILDKKRNVILYK